MYFLLSSMSVVYVLTTPIPEDDGDDATVEQIRKRAKWDNDDYVCRGLILNGMSDLYFHLRIEESLDAQDSESQSNNVAGSTVIDVPNPGLILLMINIALAFIATLNLRFKFYGMLDWAISSLRGYKICQRIGIKCIFVGYAEHSKAFRFFVIEPNGSVSINSIIESRDTIFNENRFSLVPRPSLRIPNRTEDIGGLVVPEEDDLKKFDEAIKSQDAAFWKKTINDEITPSWATTLGCWLIYLQVANLLVEWIFKRKLKVDGTIEKFKARLVIQGFKQNSRIYYFDTYALVTRISTIRLLIAMPLIHNLIIHQMDVKIAFLNGDLDEEQAPKQWHQKLDEVVLSNGYLVNQADKCVNSKFDEFGKGVIICLYVDDMLIFGTNQL
ncbi:zinc finger, CCHC-type containing protein [Tanacetum coccineum]